MRFESHSGVSGQELDAEGVIAVGVDVLHRVWSLGLDPYDPYAGRLGRLPGVVEARSLPVVANPRRLVDDHDARVAMPVLGLALAGAGLDLEDARERPFEKNPVRARR